MSRPLTFDELPLHDAVLRQMVVDWESRTCRLHLSVFLDPHADAVSCTLTWTDVTEICVPMRRPWGPSVFINGKTKEGSNRYLIELQSGDVLVIEAGQNVFERDGAGAL